MAPSQRAPVWDFEIRPAEPNKSDYEKYSRIEQAAGEVFLEHEGLEYVGLPEITPLTTFEEYQSATSVSNPNEHAMFAHEKGKPKNVIGYVGIRIMDGYAFITDISVDPKYQRRGAGTKLLNAAEDFAALFSKNKGVSLTTWRDLPFNGPWYEKRGYQYVDDPSVLGPEHAAYVEGETKHVKKMGATDKGWVRGTMVKCM